MTKLENDRFLRALNKQRVDVTPVWLMRQAGRYLPEYRAVRAKAKTFMNLCKTPELACEITLQPIHRFPLDAAIIFSDILTIPEAMGLELNFVENEGPQFATSIKSAQDIAQLKTPDMETQLRYVMDAIRLVRHELNGKIPLIGFSGSPWTLATYMVEGGGSRSFELIKKFLFTEPELLQRLLERLTSAVIDYLNAQIAAGAQAVMIFDTWGGILTTQDYQTFSLDYMTRIVRGLNRHYENNYIPVILFTKNGGQWLESIAASNCDAIGIDWTTDIGLARKRVGAQVALQGNMDPSVLYAAPERIQQEVATILQSYGKGPGHIFNLGHGIHKDIEPEKVKVFVEAVHEFSKIYHCES